MQKVKDVAIGVFNWFAGLIEDHPRKTLVLFVALGIYAVVK